MSEVCRVHGSELHSNIWTSTLLLYIARALNGSGLKISSVAIILIENGAGLRTGDGVLIATRKI